MGEAATEDEIKEFCKEKVKHHSHVNEIVATCKCAIIIIPVRTKTRAS